jgi:hypothetical protein
MTMTRAEAREFQDRWNRVNTAEREELRRMTLSDKLLQIAALMASVEPLGWQQALAEEDQQVRERWLRLRKACHAA